MDTIKISVDVNVNLSETTKAFFINLFGHSSVAQNVKCVSPAVDMTAKSDSSKGVDSSKSETKSAEPTQNKATATTAASTVKIDQVRKALAEKVNDHRANIKAKLEELGAPSVTKLDPSKYEEMYNFLINL